MLWFKYLNPRSLILHFWNPRSLLLLGSGASLLFHAAWTPWCGCMLSAPRCGGIVAPSEQFSTFGSSCY